MKKNTTKNTTTTFRYNEAHAAVRTRIGKMQSLLSDHLEQTRRFADRSDGYAAHLEHAAYLLQNAIDFLQTRIESNATHTDDGQPTQREIDKQNAKLPMPPRKTKTPVATIFGYKMLGTQRCVDVSLQQMRTSSDVFWSENNNSFVLAAKTAGSPAAWMLNGTPCHLLSVNGIGEVRWPVYVHEATNKENAAAIAHFGIVANNEGGR